ncbi:molybdate ABC transporter substrate-binding protein [Deinococcus sp. Marseille-Q6407]|uniref:molybdate ABC transporter substrate-binding protein n=1 Tax=Deinococcus sp. Marseille-Q6407 TaxID=2969223 RepID=UPI0021C14C21|nr:molybdate ABC transporter substrate-binding protein [Deinococcus sp. Marseille-Q6407]
MLCLAACSAPQNDQKSQNAQGASAASVGRSASESSASGAATDTGSASATASGAAGEQTTLTLAVAASLREVVTEAAQAYQQQHPGTQVRITAAGSGALLQQLKAGAPADLFLSADTKTMRQAADAGLLAGPAHTLVYNRLVLIAPQGEKLPFTLPASAEQAAQWLSAQSGKAKVAIGQPDSVPAGRYAQSALERLNVWEQLKPRLVYGENVRQVMDWVAHGEAQAGFVYATDAALMPQKVQVVANLPVDQPIEYQLAQLKQAPAPAAAAEVLDFLQSPQAQSIFNKYGFLSAPDQQSSAQKGN